MHPSQRCLWCWGVYSWSVCICEPPTSAELGGPLVDTVLP